VSGERRSFALLRPISNTAAQERIRALVLTRSADPITARSALHVVRTLGYASAGRPRPGRVPPPASHRGGDARQPRATPCPRARRRHPPRTSMSRASSGMRPRQAGRNAHRMHQADVFIARCSVRAG
jgi:hypothetical protein